MTKLPCGCDPNPKRPRHCQEAADLLNRCGATLFAALEATITDAGDDLRARAWQLFTDDNAAYLRHMRGEA